MSSFTSYLLLIFLLMVSLCSAGKAKLSGTKIVRATDIVQAATLTGTALTTFLDANSGTAPAAIKLKRDVAFVNFTVSGAIYVCINGGCPVDLDGSQQLYNNGCASANGISGLKSLGSGFLTGVFINGSVSATGTKLAPTLDYTESGVTFRHHAPEKNMAFFIGDGLSGTGSGYVQWFRVPPGVNMLYLGISDCYGGTFLNQGNTGEVQVDYDFHYYFE